MADMQQYVISNSLRKVVPYWHTGVSYVKGRWLKRTILDVLQDEFKSRSRSFYIQEINHNRVEIVRDGVSITGSSLLEVNLQNKDILRLTSHKHEPLVVYQDRIPVIYENDDIVVVNKPSSIPVHPTGRYYNNTLTELLKIQLNLPNIHPCHRLDKLTSGVLILGKSAQIASEIQKQIKDREVQKHYLARVMGRFPEGEIVCEEAVGNIDTKLGFTNGVKERKEARTVFIRLKYNSELNESIVLCKPLTGRTHQIRIHLNYLHHPIVNDPLYGPKASKIRHEMINSKEITDEQFQRLNKEDMERMEILKMTDQKCKVCDEELFEDPKLEDLILWLHAYMYDFDQFHFKTEEPEWCDISNTSNNGKE